MLANATTVTPASNTKATNIFFIVENLQREVTMIFNEVKLFNDRGEKKNF